jgi:glycosyltransferase involved in cell wall biosynthesis
MEGNNMYSACVTKMTKEFGVGNGVIYVDRPEDVLNKAIELIENETLKEQGLKARRFVEKNSWDNITDEFERVLEGISFGGNYSRWQI